MAGGGDLGADSKLHQSGGLFADANPLEQREVMVQSR
jgi:hypothetical protein